MHVKTSDEIVVQAIQYLDHDAIEEINLTSFVVQITQTEIVSGDYDLGQMAVLNPRKEVIDKLNLDKEPTVEINLSDSKIEKKYVVPPLKNSHNTNYKKSTPTQTSASKTNAVKKPKITSKFSPHHTLKSSNKKKKSKKGTPLAVITPSSSDGNKKELFPFVTATGKTKYLPLCKSDCSTKNVMSENGTLPVIKLPPKPIRSLTKKSLMADYNSKIPTATTPPTCIGVPHSKSESIFVVCYDKNCFNIGASSGIDDKGKFNSILDCYSGVCVNVSKNLKCKIAVDLETKIIISKYDLANLEHPEHKTELPKNLELAKELMESYNSPEKVKVYLDKKPLTYVSDYGIILYNKSKGIKWKT